MIPKTVTKEDGVSVWFACKECNQCFQNIDNFLKHKKEVHFNEFQKFICIVFEEKTTITNNLGYDFPDDSSIPPEAVLKQELELFSSGVQHLDLKPEVYNEQGTEGETDDSICPAQNETRTFPQNPYVLLKRLPPPSECHEHNTTQSAQEIQVHPLETPPDIRPFKCPMTNCGKSFKTRKYLRAHLDTHALGNRFSCTQPNCPKAFKTRTNLRSHLFTHTHLRIFKCPQPNCGKAFKTRKDVMQHLKIHTEELKFKCQEPNCGKAFKTKNHLRLHQTIHSESRLCFHCPFPNCGKVFSRKYLLKKHFLSRHGHNSQDSSSSGSGKISFEFRSCGGFCLTRRPQRRPEDRKPIMCSQPNCTKIFQHESSLRLHLAKHSSSKPFKCPVPNCNKTYKSPYTVKIHVQKMHSE